MAKKSLIIQIAVKGARAATKALKGVGRAVIGVGKAAKNAMFSFKGLAGMAGMGLAIKAAGDFQKGMLEINTLMPELTKGAMRNMRVELQRLAQETGQAIQPLVKANYDIVSAGFATAADSALVLNSAAKLATAGNTDVATSADILTSALNAYGAEASSAMEVSDLLFTTVRFGKTTVGELGSQLGQVLPFAKMAGASLDDVGAAMATMTTKGIDTARASTSIRAAFLSLASPTVRQTKWMKEYGIEIKKLDDGSMDLVGTIKQFAKVDPEALRKVVPSVEALTAIQTLGGDIELLATNLGRMGEKAGATQTAYTTMQKSFNVQMSKMKEGFQAAMTTIGQVMIDKIMPKVLEVNEALGKIADIGWDAIGETITTNWSMIMERMMWALDAFVGYMKYSFLASFHEMVAEGGKMMQMLLGTNEKSSRMLANTYKVTADNMKANALSIGEGVFDFIITKAEETAEILGGEGEDGLTGATEVATEAMYGYALALQEGNSNMEKIDETIKGTTKRVINLGREATKAFDIMFDPKATGGDKIKEFAKQFLTMCQSIVLSAMAVAESIQTMFAGGIGVVTGIIALAAIAALKVAVENLKFAQFGMDEIVSKPTLIMAGEGNRRERVTVSPLDSGNARGSQGNGQIVINVTAPLVDETVIDAIIPAINRANRLGIT
jgi:TP901 family phage tail tape measure protein